ncbi:MAG TPA: ion channel [Steroidobacteraceae bacterium]|nr:ion channel [Steroidobacteraceae bacterium]
MANSIVVLATIGIIALVVFLHYETLRACIQFLPRLAHRRRRRVALLILIILATHAAEIWLFALGYYFLLAFDGLGELAGASAGVLTDYVYYSSMVYTTVGFGEIVPRGPIRFMSGMEGLTGLVMITWSASFTFLEMQRDWPAHPGRRDP